MLIFSKERKKRCEFQQSAAEKRDFRIMIVAKNAILVIGSLKKNKIFVRRARKNMRILSGESDKAQFSSNDPKKNTKFRQREATYTPEISR